MVLQELRCHKAVKLDQISLTSFILLLNLFLEPMAITRNIDYLISLYDMTAIVNDVILFNV